MKPRRIEDDSFTTPNIENLQLTSRGRVYLNAYQVSVLFLLGLLAVPTASAFSGAAQTAQVPPEYQQLYSTLKSSLDDFNATLATMGPGTGSPIFGAELLPANSNREDALLAPNTMQAVILYLDRLKELGIGGVTFPIGFPLYTPSFPDYSAYVQFYKQVVQEVRKRGMVEIESSILFANTAFSPITFDYSKLTPQQFEAERKEMVSAFIQDLQPDYLDLGAEPDTQYKLTGFTEFNSPNSYTTYVNHILEDLNRGHTKLGAGSGTWLSNTYVQSLGVNTSLDFISLHVYPVVGPTLQRLLTFSDIAKQYGKRVVLDEAWLYKVGTLQASSIVSNVDVFRNDAFSFWVPLDQEFLAVMVTAAKVEGIGYISPFWSMQFFGYVDYTSSTAGLSYQDLATALGRVASQNILNNQFSPTGTFYGQLAGNGLTTTTAAATQPTATTVSLTDKPSGLVLIAGLVAAIAIVAAVVLSRRR
ncbi:MAG: hypothetical protein ABSA50_06850 [Candidatus Bathyarchaeia archaeon]